jgi:hypothetical protein
MVRHLADYSERENNQMKTAISNLLTIICNIVYLSWDRPDFPLILACRPDRFPNVWKCPVSEPVFCMIGGNDEYKAKQQAIWPPEEEG